MKRVIFAASLLLIDGFLPACKSNQAGTNVETMVAKKITYRCPMHPSYISNKPGNCPICSMALVPIEDSPAQTQGPTKVLYYQNPMRPDVKSPVPMKDEMGMDYIPVYEEKAARPLSVTGQGAINLSAGKEQMIGVRTEPVQKRDLELLIRASGRVAFDPDLYNAITEYKEAVKAKEKIKDSPFPDVGERSDALIQSSLMRLRLMGISESQINELAAAGPAPRNLLLAEKGGKSWVYAQVYEYESPYVKPGQMMEVTSTAFPGQKFSGRIRSVDAVLNPETRSLKVRAEIENPNGFLKPEMFVDAVVHAVLGRKLAVPKEAVLDTGTRQLVYVETSPGHYEPRELKMGVQAEKYAEVISGVKEGEKVAISANFLLDSESKLKATR